MRVGELREIARSVLCGLKKFGRGLCSDPITQIDCRVGPNDDLELAIVGR
jgi:hypothetical protein